VTEERGRGWGAALALALFAVLVSSIHPALLLAVPLGLLMVGLPPLRSPYRLVGALLLVLLFAAPMGGAVWMAERGWSLLVGGSFLAVVALWPRGGFLHRGLAAIAAAVVVAAAVLGIGGAWRGLEMQVAERFRAAADFWSERMTAGDAAGAEQAAETFARIAELEIHLYPAMLTLASLAALGAVWFAYRRLVDRSRDVLPPLRQFRFDDHLVWLFIVGAVLVVVPLNEAASRAGANLATFMAALYVLRGAAVVIALTAPAGLMAWLLAGFAVLMLPFVAGAALIVGLSDTWLDLRARMAARGES